MVFEGIAFITNAHYELTSQCALIHYYGRLDSGKSFEATATMDPYFFIKEEDELAAKKLLHINTSKTSLQSMNNETLVKVCTKNPKEIPKIRRLFEDENIVCFEADIKFVRKYFMDQNVLSIAYISGEEKTGKWTDLYFESPSINFIDPLSKDATKARPTLLSFDIETTPDATKIHSISFVTKDKSFAYIVSNEKITQLQDAGKKLQHATVFPTEKKLIQAFCEVVRKLDPDVLVGWNVIDFDLAVIAQRAKKYDVPFIIGRSDQPASLRIESNFLRDSSVYLHGRLVLDGIHILKSSFVNLDDYKLNTAAKHFVDDSKLIEDDDRFDILEDLYRDDPQQLIDYNIKDSQLVVDILEKSQLFELTVQRSILTGLRMDEVKASIASFDSLYLRELHKKGFVAPTTHPSASSQEGLGGFVMSSKPGIYENVLVLDFKSLYPSIMRTFNIDPLDYCGVVEELRKKNIEVDNPEKYIIAPNDAVFKNSQDGILPRLLKRLWEARDQAKKNNDELARYAIKIHMNSMYGVLASPNSRFHIRPLSNAITYFAQFFIKKTAQRLGNQGVEVIYGDTDSVFVNTKTKDAQKAKEIGFTIQDDLNSFLQEYVSKHYKRDSMLELEFEKQYLKFFLPNVRGDSSKGAKKRYAGLKIDAGKDLSKEKPVMDFTGLEFVRRDWTELSKEFQLTLLNKLFAEEPLEEYIKKFVADLKKGNYDDLLVYKKALRKKVEEYTKTTPPHVKAAKLLDKIEGSIISYVITTQGPQPIQKQTAPIDYNHYIEKQLRPIANSILELQNSSFDDVLKGSKQKGLGGFF